MYMYWGATGQVVPETDGRARRPLTLLAVVALLVAAVTVAVAWVNSAPSRAHVTNVVTQATTGAVALESPRIVKQNRLPPPTVAPPPSVAPPTTASRPAPAPTVSTSRPSTTGTVSAAESSPATTVAPAGEGCSAALAYLATHAAPGFRFECPGDALGHQGMTCVDVAGVCPGSRLIVIADACPAAYMNEAHNSWILTGLAAGSFDPYGYCH